MNDVLKIQIQMNNIFLIFTKIDHILFLHVYYLLKICIINIYRIPNENIIRNII